MEKNEKDIDYCTCICFRHIIYFSFIWGDGVQPITKGKATGRNKKGEDGIDGVSEWDTGVDGGSGGTGGNGGAGGIPVIGEIDNDYNYIVYLYGGNGGAGGTGGTGGRGGVSSLDIIQANYDSSLFVFVNASEILPGIGGAAGKGGSKGYITNHSWDHGTYYGNNGGAGTAGIPGEN